MSLNTEVVVGHKTITVKYTEWGEFVYRASFCVSFGYRGKRLTSVTDEGIELRRLWADGELIFDSTGDKRLTDLRWHFLPGHEDQMPVDGAELAYRGHILVWFTEYNLGDNPHIPAFSAEFWDTEEFTVAGALETLADRAGFAPEDVVVTGLTDRDLIGYMLDGRSSLESIASDLGFLYNFSFVEVAGVVTFAHKYEAGVLVIDHEVEDRLALLREGDQTEIDNLERNSEQGLPTRMSVQYFDYDANYEPGNQSVQRNNGPIVTNSSMIDMSISLPVVAQGGEFRGLLFDALYRTWQDRNGHALRLPPEFLLLDPSDTLSWTSYGGNYSGLAVKTTINADHSVSLSVVEKASTYDAVVVSTQTPATPVPAVIPEPVQAVLFDVSDSAEEQVQDGYINLRVAVGRGDGADAFHGARLDMALLDQPGSWLPRVTFEADQEVAIGSLAATPASDAETITINAGTITEAQLTAGENHTLHMVIGGGAYSEVFSYETWDEDAPGVYELHNCIRGLFGTDGFINQHAEDDPVAFYDDLVIVPIPITEFKDNKNYLYRVVAAYGRVTNAEVKVYLPVGNSRKPYSPNNVAVSRLLLTGGGDIVVTWDEDVRFSGEPEPKTYSVDIYSADWQTVIRRINTIMDGNEFTYFIEEQIIDGLNEDLVLNILVFQTNFSHVGRGYPGGGEISIFEENNDLQGVIDVNPYLEAELYDTRLEGYIFISPPTLTGELDDGFLSGVIDADPLLTGEIADPSSLEGVIDVDPTVAGDLEVTVFLSGIIDADPILTGEIEDPTYDWNDADTVVLIQGDPIGLVIEEVANGAGSFNNTGTPTVDAQGWINVNTGGAAHYTAWDPPGTSELTPTANWTIEFYMKTSTAQSGRGFLSRQVSGTARYALYGGDASMSVYFNATLISTIGSLNLDDGLEHHIAFTKAGTTHRLFVDGTLVDTDTTATTPAAHADWLYCGVDIADTINRRFVGALDRIRISDICRYTANFTPEARR